jgi:hypothetical protein
LKKYDNLENKYYEVTYRKLWKDQGKFRKLGVVENCKRQVDPVMNKRCRYMEITGCTEEEINEFYLNSEKKPVIEWNKKTVS